MLQNRHTTARVDGEAQEPRDRSSNLCLAEAAYHTSAGLCCLDISRSPDYMLLCMIVKCWQAVCTPDLDFFARGKCLSNVSTA